MARERERDSRFRTGNTTVTRDRVIHHDLEWELSRGRSRERERSKERDYDDLRASRTTVGPNDAARFTRRRLTPTAIGTGRDPGTKTGATARIANAMQTKSGSATTNRRRPEKDRGREKDQGERDNKHVSLSTPRNGGAEAREVDNNKNAPSSSNHKGVPSLHEFLATVKQERASFDSTDGEAGIKKEKDDGLQSPLKLPASSATTKIDPQMKPPELLAEGLLPTPPPLLPMPPLPIMPPQLVGPMPTAPGDLALYPAYVQACEKMKELLGECGNLRTANEKLEKEKTELKAKAMEARDGKLTKDEKYATAMNSLFSYDLR